ncbi:uncharacterized protein EV154DRAFT_487669 [Mucor mucedo]|uniref:uncharacterized protein n=1 Tax=Mucor mucedo TaxID=29922 RepID=UPI0022205232|nr:uncharacterized protein EV154DRAFT_487669 [Mucor mucedo]KAI7871395.1 hypothetical protein EV154DRAFT_487669 [Mucor mucedo]
MSQEPTPTDQEVKIGIPYLSPTLNKNTTTTSTRKINKNQQKNTKTNDNEQQKKREEENATSSALGIMSIDQENITGKKRSASTSPGIGIDEMLNEIQLANKEHLNEQQIEFINKFNKHQKKIECQECKGAWININRIDNMEVGDEESTEIVLTCKKCTKHYAMEEVQEIMSRATKEKKRQIGEKNTITGKKKGVQYTEEIEAVVVQYELHRGQISCKKCNTIGSLQKNGSNQSKPPKPQYKCKKCEKGTTYDEMKTILKYETQSTSEEQMELDTERGR